MTQQAKHTPGPWVKNQLEIKSGDVVLAIATIPCLRIIVDGETSGEVKCPPIEEAHGNARILSAAFDMLSALEGLYRWENREHPEDHYCAKDRLNPCYDPKRDTGKPVQHWGSEDGQIIPACPHCVARAAIAKAKGCSE